MFKNKSALLTISLVVLIFGLLLGNQAFSQHHCYYDNWMSDKGVKYWNKNIPSQHFLSSEQRTKINKIQTKTREVVIPLQKELKNLRLKYHNNSVNQNLDTEKIKSYRNKIRDLEEKIFDLRLEARKKVNEVLTKGQWQFYSHDGYCQWDLDRKWRHSTHQGSHSHKDHNMMGNHTCCW